MWNNCSPKANIWSSTYLRTHLFQWKCRNFSGTWIPRWKSAIVQTSATIRPLFNNGVLSLLSVEHHTGDHWRFILFGFLSASINFLWLVSVRRKNTKIFKKLYGSTIRDPHSTSVRLTFAPSKYMCPSTLLTCTTLWCCTPTLCTKWLRRPETMAQKWTDLWLENWLETERKSQTTSLVSRHTEAYLEATFKLISMVTPR